MNKEKVRNILFLFIPLVILALDIWSKYLVQKNLPLHTPVEIWGNFLRFTFLYNRGMALGMLNQSNPSVTPIILTVLNAVVLGIMVYFYVNLQRFIKPGRPQIWGRLALLFIIGGALGNNIDRLFLFNENGMLAVVDFIDTGIGNYRFYTYNVADSAIFVGSIALGILFIFFERKEPREDKEGDESNENKDIAISHEEQKKEA